VQCVRRAVGVYHATSDLRHCPHWPAQNLQQQTTGGMQALCTYLSIMQYRLLHCNTILSACVVFALCNLANLYALDAMLATMFAELDKTHTEALISNSMHKAARTAPTHAFCVHKRQQMCNMSMLMRTLKRIVQQFCFKTQTGTCALSTAPLAYFKQMNKGVDIPFYMKMLSGMGSGAIAVTIGTPFDVALVRMQSDSMKDPRERR
jgi:Mitochondrial carrier protein